MKIEIRADGAHISGYVNVTGKRSRPVITPHGKVIEEIEPRAFEQAIGRAGNITVTVDHDNSHVYASTDDGTLKMFEDDIGLHADVLVTDETLIELAKKGKVKGCSESWGSAPYPLTGNEKRLKTSLNHGAPPHTPMKR